MKTIIQEADDIADNLEVSINDDGFNVPGWVTIRIGDITEDVHLDDLHHAVLVFYSKYRNQLDKEAS